MNANESIDDLPTQSSVIKMPLAEGERPKLIGSRCRVCNYTSFPRKTACPKCMRDDTMAQALFLGHGKLVSFTTVRVSQAGFEAPYVLAEIELDDGPHILSQIVGRHVEGGPVDVGDEVEMVLNNVGNVEVGRNLSGFRFQLVGNGRRAK